MRTTMLAIASLGLLCVPAAAQERPRDGLRSAFAIRAPEPELCRLDLLSGMFCRNPGSRRGM